MADKKINLDSLIAEAKAAQARAKAEADASIAALQQSRASQNAAAQAANLARQAAALDPELDRIERMFNTQLSKFMAGDKTVTEASLRALANRYNSTADQKTQILNQAKVAGQSLKQQAKAATTPPATVTGTGTGRGRVGADVTAPAAPAEPATTGKTTTAKPTPTTAITPKPTGATQKPSAGTKTPSPTPGTQETPKTATEALTAKQKAILGTYGSQYLIDYFKTNKSYTIKSPYSGKIVSIFDYLQQAAIKGENNTNVSNVLMGTSWYKDVNERYKASIYSIGRANGIELDNSQVENYRDMFLGKVKTLEEINYNLGQQAIQKYNLDISKPELAKAISAGKSFTEAASDYLASYADDLGLAASQVSVTDPQFLSILNSSVSLDDFKKKTKYDPRFLSKPESQQSIAANVATLQQKYARYGINIDPAKAQTLAQNLFLGDTSINVVEENLRKDAASIFTPFRDRILAGEDPLSIATPYISAMERILEVPGGSLGLNDSTVRAAMMGSTVTKGDTTTHSAIPLWQFEQSLYKDNRWQYTDNAHKTMDSITLDVLSRFGLIG